MVRQLVFILPTVSLPHWISPLVVHLWITYERNIHENLCGSDYFPVILTSNGVEEDAAPNRWNFKKAHLLSFQAE